MFMGSAVFVGFLQNPDGLVFFVFSNIACAITSQEGFSFRISGLGKEFFLKSSQILRVQFLGSLI